MFYFGGLGALFGGAKPNKSPPWRQGCTEHGRLIFL